MTAVRPARQSDGLATLAAQPKPAAVAEPQPRKILLFTGSLFNESSGPYLSVKQTAHSLQRRGHSVTTLGTCGSGDGALSGRDGEVRAFRRHGPYSAHFAPGLRRWLDREPARWDLASIQGLWFHGNHAAAAWCARNRRPLLVTPHGTLNPDALGISGWKKRLARATFMRRVFAAATCYQAGTEAEYLALRDYGIRAPICIVGNGIDLPDPATIPDPQDVLPPDLLERRTCLYLGRLAPIKGIDRLLRAWAAVAPDDAWQLVIAGGGAADYSAELGQVARRAGCRNVHFAGFVPGNIKAAWFRQAELFVLPSHSEAFAMAPMEAFSHGTPALLTTGCGFPEAAEAGAAHEVASTETAIAEGLARMLARSSESLSDMGAAAHAFVSERYNWDTVCAQLESVYDWMCGAGGAPACMQWD